RFRSSLSCCPFLDSRSLICCWLAVTFADSEFRPSHRPISKPTTSNTAIPAMDSIPIPIPSLCFTLIGPDDPLRNIGRSCALCFILAALHRDKPSVHSKFEHGSRGRPCALSAVSLYSYKKCPDTVGQGGP